MSMRLSKNRLSDEQRNQLITQFTELLGKLNRAQAHNFYTELFGFEEKEVFAKRLAIVLMIHEKRSGYAIAHLLKVSETTVAKLTYRYNSGDFDNIISYLTKRKKNYVAVLQLLDSILTVGGIMPHRNYVLKRKR